LIGDAAAFIDPLFSSGVMMAMSSAALGVEVVHAWLDDRTLGKKLMHDYERSVRGGLNSLSWLIYRINKPMLRDIFMASFDLFNTRNGLLTILAGDFYEKPRLFSPLRRLQLAYGCLCFLSRVGVRLGTQGLTWEWSRMARTKA
jgi:flavin-dependent dehydrogenase